MSVKIAVAGTGYVGLSIATLLSQHHHVTAVDVIPEKVDMINRHQSPIQDEYIEKYLREKPLDLVATTDAVAAYRDADFVVIATPTNYDPVKNYFDTKRDMPVKTSSLLPNSCAKAKPFTTISTRVASSSDVLKATNDSMKRPMNSLHSCRKVPLKKT